MTVVEAEASRFVIVDGAVRGLVSGLGLLNLWIAFHDAIRHRDG